ncbi:MAG: sulfite exporter TauE/SafE family protein [Xanthobacteraceae bacterium]
MGIVIAILGLCLGGLLKGATGAGGPIIAIPILAMYFDVPLAVTIFVMPNLLTNLWQSWTYRKHQLPPRFVILFAGGGGIGAGIGTVLLANLPAAALTTTVAVAVYAYLLFRILHPDWVLPYALAERLAFPASALAGALGGAVGVSAPVSLTFLNAMRLTRPQFIATISIFFIMMGVVQVPMLIAYNFLDWTRFMLSVGAIVPVLAFMPVGAWLARHVSPAVFDRIVLILLAAIAARLILQAW